MANDKYAKFDNLESEGGAGQPSKLSEHMTFLKGKLSAEDYAAAITQLGVKTEMSNAELLTEFKALLDAAGPPEDEEKEKGKEHEKPIDSALDQIASDMGVSADDIKAALAELMPPEDGKKKEEEEDPEHMAAPNYKDFIKSEMEKGATLAEAIKKFKEKYPDAEVDEKANSEIEHLKDLETRLATLEGDKNTSELSGKVDNLVKDKHLSPKQAEPMKALAGNLSVEDQDRLLGFFRETQKFNVHSDVGLAPGKGGAHELDDATKSIILEKHGLGDLIKERGIQKEYSFMKTGVNQ